MDENKGRGNQAAGILASLFLQVAIKYFLAAREVSPVVVLSERLNDPRGG